MPIYKNQPRTVAFQMLQTSGLPYTGTPPTVQVYRDALVPVQVSGAQHVGDGYWKIDLTASHLDADLVVLVATATDCIPAQREIYTESDWSFSRAGKLDNLDVTVSSRSTFTGGNVAGVSSPVTVGDYSSGKDPGTYVLRTPSQKLATDAAGSVSVFANSDKTGYGIRASDSGVVLSGLVTSATTTTATIPGGDPTDSLYVGSRINIVAGTGAGQSRVVTGYVGSTQTITIDRPWVIVPNGSSSFMLQADSNAKLDGGLNVEVGAYASGLDPSTALTAAGVTTARAANLDRLDANVSSRLAQADYVASPTANLLLDSLSAAGFTSQRAGNLDRLDASVSTRLAATDFQPPLTASQIAASILADPSSPIQTTASGKVQIDLSQRVPALNDPETIGDSLNAARAQGFGAWTLDLNGRTLKLFAADGVTVVRTFTLDSMTSPTSRV